MNGNEFIQKHEEWQGKTSKSMKQETPRTWLMTEAGNYFPLEGDLDAELERMRGLDLPCTAHHDHTSLTMKAKQAEKRGFKDEPPCIECL